MIRITDQASFAARRDAIVAQYGDKLIVQDPTDMKLLASDCEPLARYCRLSVDQFIRVLSRRYVEETHFNTKPRGASS